MLRLRPPTGTTWRELGLITALTLGGTVTIYLILVIRTGGFQ